MRAMLTEELLRLGTAQARAAEEQAHHRPWGNSGKMLVEGGCPGQGLLGSMVIGSVGYFTYLSRWWQLKYFLFSSPTWGKYPI